MFSSFFLKSMRARSLEISTPTGSQAYNAVPIDPASRPAALPQRQSLFFFCEDRSAKACDGDQFGRTHTLMDGSGLGRPARVPMHATACRRCAPLCPARHGTHDACAL